MDSPIAGNRRMPVDLRTVTQSDVDRILALAEDHFHDVKSTRISPAKLTESISSFANADGGTLYVGVAEDKVTGKKSWEGFETIEAANGHIQIFEELFALGDGFQYTFLTLEGDTRCVLQVEVLKSPSVRKASNGIVYLRRSAQKLPQRRKNSWRDCA
jgi:ATP-dependent DNA helicase RecG